MKKLYPYISYFEEKEFRELQEELYELTGAKASLIKWKPHITVGKALELSSIELSELTKELDYFVNNQKSFKVELKNFGFMDNWKGSKLFNCEPYVIYIDVVLNSNLISFVENLDEILKKYDSNYDIFPYNPHLTLAFKDLDKKGFEKAKEFLKNKEFSKIVKIKGFSIATDKKVKEQFEEVSNFKF